MTKEHVTRLYVFAIMWSIGALLELDERLKLQEYILDNNDRLELDLPALTEGANETVFEYYVDIEGKIIVKKNGNWDASSRGVFRTLSSV